MPAMLLTNVVTMAKQQEEEEVQRPPPASDVCVCVCGPGSGLYTWWNALRSGTEYVQLERENYREWELASSGTVTCGSGAKLCTSL